MVTGVANLRPRRVGLRCVGFDHLVKRDQKEMVERSGPRSRERGGTFRARARYRGPVHRSDDRFAINSLTRFADHSAWPC
jgi:hypothetical protein